jgi:SPP1 family predicted phage head-tail adaptor
VSAAITPAAPPLGALTDRVQLFKRDVNAEDEGGEVTTYVPLATVWARVRTLSARQVESADGRGVAITHSAVLRYRSDLSPGDRLVYAGRNLELVGADDLNGRRAYLACTLNETGLTG